MYTLRPSTSLQMPNIELHRPGIEPGPPPDRMWTLYHWAMESVHNVSVLVSWPPGRGQILCNYSTPPTHQQASMYTYTIVGGGALPASPVPLNTCSHNTATRRPPHPSNTQQHTTTVHNSTRVHKITNVPLFKKLWDIIFFGGTITLWAISRDILRGPRLFWPLNCPSLRSGQFKGSKKSWPPQNVPWNGS